MGEDENTAAFDVVMAGEANNDGNTITVKVPSDSDGAAATVIGSTMMNMQKDMHTISAYRNILTK
ncbi:hypothetical protein W97_00735 [Coniosporium apollinis CBS 100218]|uniref:Uncharacterized protein n=1 Tax=Coniosporium apollinis (strain CBS 100218) TaxID=1168221 RepID=R7YHZ9_CONA1|nr:uncharacterized protein W97_00735 [Coniosporium apollinis CBS 100218]EON61520.1 hypothetical protein W97_00735 [Coniosporium apollinis CBS 100218]